MRKIYKYKFTDSLTTIYIDDVYIEKFLHIEFQYDHLCVWAEVNTDRPPKTYELRVFGTGFPLDNESIYIGTALTEGGTFVFHVYYIDLGWTK